MTLSELIIVVKEEGLTKDKLEQYHTEITYLDNLMRLELAPIEKEEALFFQDNKEVKTEYHLPENKDIKGVHTYNVKKHTDVEIKRMWRATEKGQRQIELNHYLKITPKLLQSLRTRLYSAY